MDWTGLERWNGLDWNGGLDWTGLDWTGLEWNAHGNTHTHAQSCMQLQLHSTQSLVAVFNILLNLLESGLIHHLSWPYPGKEPWKALYS